MDQTYVVQWSRTLTHSSFTTVIFSHTFVIYEQAIVFLQDYWVLLGAHNPSHQPPLPKEYHHHLPLHDYFQHDLYFMVQHFAVDLWDFDSRTAVVLTLFHCDIKFDLMLCIGNCDLKFMSSYILIGIDIYTCHSSNSSLNWDKLINFSSVVGHCDVFHGLMNLSSNLFYVCSSYLE